MSSGGSHRPPGEVGATPAQSWSPLSVLDWFDRTGRFAASSADMLDGLSRALVDIGAPINRTRFTFQTLHPLMRVLTVKWWPDSGATDELGSRHGLEGEPKYVGSPFQRIVAERRPVRRRLSNIDPTSDHRVLFEIRDGGGTDYLAVPLRFAGLDIGMFAVVSADPAGFTDDQVAGFIALGERIAPALEALIHRRIARTLLETYVGKRSGSLVLQGQVKRGDAEAVMAAFWYSDIVDFTQLTEARAIDEVLDVVNSIVERVWQEAQPRGGEIVNLIGDALLMMFPAGEGRDAPAACRAALATAGAALRATQDDERLHFGVGLHFGQAIYGNIGAPDRLDFTVMGAAVNRTARLEALTREVGRPVLASAAFVEAAGIAADFVGEHRVKGVAAPLRAYAPLLG